MKNLVAIIIALMLIAPVLVSVSLPLQADAAVPVIETNPSLIIDAIRQQWWIQIERVLLATLKKELLNNLSNMTLNWLQGGGEPRFITNWEDYLGEAAFGGAADFYKNFPTSKICEPYQDTIKRIFNPRNLGGGLFGEQPGPTGRAECSLNIRLGGSGSLQNRIELFRNDFAAGGGWDAWLAMLSPENNPYWNIYNASQEQALSIAAATEAAKLQGQANKGFTGSRKCLASYVDDLSGETICTRWQITTPGSLEADIASRYLAGPDIDYIVNTDDLASLIGGLVDTAFNRIIGSASKGILGLTPQDIPPGGTFTKAGCTGLTGAAKIICQQQQTSQPICGPAFQPYSDALTETKGIKTGSLTDIDALIATLQQIRATGCRDTSAEIAARQTQKIQIEQEIFKLNSFIGAISSATCDYTPPKSIQTLETERDAAQTERQEIQQKTIEWQSVLTACTTPQP